MSHTPPKMSLVIMKASITHLKRVYLWPDSDGSEKLVYLNLILGCFLMVGSIMRVAAISIRGDNVSVINSIENIICQFGAMYFNLFFVVNRKQVLDFMKELSDMEKFGKPPHFDQRNKELDKMSTLFRIALHCCITVDCVWPVVYTKDCEKTGIDVCGLVSPIWLPFDYSYFPIKQLIYIYQCYCCFVAYGGGGAYSMVMLETMEHLVIKIQHLKILINDVMEEKDPHKRHKLMGRWVDYHDHILKIGEAMDKNYRVSLSTHVVSAGALFGFIGHQILEDVIGNFTSITLFCGWFISLFVVCIGGQHLMDESLSVQEAVYNSKWTDVDCQFQKNIVPIIVRSQKPILIFAGPFTFCSLLLIVAVLRTAYTYVNLLNATS